MDLFFELLRVTVGTADSLSRIPGPKEWKAIYRMAEKQALSGVCFAGLQNLGANADEGFATIGMSEEMYLDWMGYAATIQETNELVNQRCVEVQRLFLEKGARSCIIKGQANHQTYGDLAMLRQSGDIDIWVEGGREKVLALVNAIRPTKEVRETHAQLDIFDDTAVEVHYRPGLIRDFRRNRKLQAFYRDRAEECFTNVHPALGITAPTVQFNAVQQMLHIYHHLFDSGIGLRQVMDYYFVLTHLPAGDKDGVMKVLSSVGVERFAAALMYVEKRVFGIEDRFLLCEPCAKDGEYLLDEIMQGGNFGHYDKRRRVRKSKSFFRSFFDVWLKNFRHARFAPMEWLMSPLWRIYYFIWRKLHGYD